MANNCWIPANPVASFPSWTKFAVNWAKVSYLLYPLHYPYYPLTLLIFEVKFCEGSWIIWRVSSTAHHTHLLDSKENSRRRRRPPLLLLWRRRRRRHFVNVFLLCIALLFLGSGRSGREPKPKDEMRFSSNQVSPLCHTGNWAWKGPPVVYPD